MGSTKAIKSHSVDLIRNVITINEDDGSLVDQESAHTKYRRCISVPETLWDIRSVMKIRTLDESMHSTYGGSDSGTKGRIRFKSVGIREYARTVGDNPSCSSGPPVRYAIASDMVTSKAGTCNSILTRIYSFFTVSHGNTRHWERSVWTNMNKIDLRDVVTLRWFFQGRSVSICFGKSGT